MFSKMFNLFKSSTPLGLLEIFLKLIPVLIGIGLIAWGGIRINDYLTKDLKVKVEQQQVLIKDYGDANKDLKEDVVKEVKSRESTVTIIEQKTEQEKKITKKASKIESDLSSRITDIDKAFKESPKTDTDVQVHIDNVSSAEIDSIWETFCTVSPDNPQCKE